MELYRQGNFTLTFSREMEERAAEMQRAFMLEDTETGAVEAYLEKRERSQTCVKEIYCEVYGHEATEKVPQRASKEITEILRRLGWTDVGSRKFEPYGSQKAWAAPKQSPLREESESG